MNELSLLSITEAIVKYLDDLGYSYKQIHEFLNTAEILIDSGWECDETGFKSVWVNLEKNKICLKYYYKSFPNVYLIIMS